MASGPARIESPDLIRELRRRYLLFDQACRNALMGCTADVRGVREWLRTEQRLGLRLQLRKCEEALNQARQKYEEARWAAARGGRSSGVEELRALEKARLRKEEVERKIAAVQKWSGILDQTIDKMMGPCHALGILLDQRTPQAVARLDRMEENLEEYFRPLPPAEAPS